MRKYKLLNSKKRVNLPVFVSKENDYRYQTSVVVSQIIALRDFECDGNLIRKGDLGGYVQNENNPTYASSYK